MSGSWQGRATWVVAVLIAVLGMTDRAARSEVLVFREGGVAWLPATIEGETVRVEAPEGPYTFLRGDFRAIQPGYWPDREWPNRAERARAGGADLQLAAARWALKHGLVEESAEMLRSADQTDSARQPTARMVAALDRLQAPCPEPDLDAIARALPGRFRVASGPHVVLFHQVEEAEASARVALLEQVVTAFYLEFASLGIDLPAPSRKLPMAWFAEKSDYRAFLRREGAEAFLNTRGYHQPSRGLVVTHDARSDDKQRWEGAALEGRRRELADFERRLSKLAPDEPIRIERREGSMAMVDRASATAWLADQRRDLDRRRLLLNQERFQIDRCIAAHELVHQLVAASRLAPSTEAFPNWLHEGLAMQFEAFRGGRWAGLGVAPEFRLSDWRSLRSTPRLAPLLRDSGLDRGYSRDPYARSWAFVFYLIHHRPAEFVALLDRLRVPSPAVAEGSDPVLSAVLETFGEDLERLQADWIRSLSEVQTPLDLVAPLLDRNREAR